MTRIPFILLSTSDGSPLTGAAPTVTISKDGGSFAAATNTTSEIGSGYYYIDLTSEETTVTNNVIVRATATGAQPAAVVWEPEANIQTELTTYGAAKTSDLSGLSTFDPSTDDVTINSTQAATLATAAALATVGDNVGAVKAKTDNLPQSPAAVGSEMALTSAAIAAVQNGLSTFNASTDKVTLNTTEDGTLTAIKTKVDTLNNTDLTGIATSTDVSNAQTAIISRGNEAWITATGFATPSDLSGLSTFNAATDTVTINSTQAAGMATATGFATPSDLASAVDSLEIFGQQYWQTANLSGLATSSQLSTATDVITAAMPDISGLPTAADVWDYTDRSLTEEISVEISSENIADIASGVWNADDRTLTDLTPKPNMKNIACTPSNVINAYGVPRLENWTNETAGTQAFDDKINTYITLAKEKMATDLNNHINAAIDYIGSDNITELCAWLTGYNLYQDDESTDTESLPETRYNQYLEQIHRIMENI